MKGMFTSTLAMPFKFKKIKTRYILILFVIAFASIFLSANLLSARAYSNKNTISAKPILPLAANNRTLIIGSYIYGGVWQGIEPIERFEYNLNQRLDIVHWFMSWNHAWNPSLLALAATNGRKPMISWEAHNQPVANIAAGQYDDYIRSWAKGAKEFGKIIYLRPLPEMNGNWTPWNGDPDNFVLAWQRIVTIFRQEGANNVVWVWAANISDYPNTATNRLENYYPGAAYVDILAMDGYNWGTSRNWSNWQSFEEIFSKPYKRISKLGNQEIWITEMSSTEIGGNKANWIEEMFASNKFPRLSAIIWFDENKELDWRVQSSDNSLEAFRQGVRQQSPNYLKSLR